MSETTPPNSEQDLDDGPEAAAAVTPADQTPEETAKPIDERKLRRALVDLFTEAEIRDLCFELRLKYENFPGKGKVAKTYDLVTFFMNRQRLNVLVEAFREARPFVNLDEIILDPDEEPLPPPIGIRQERPTADESIQSDTLTASNSFAALVRVMAQPEMYAAMQSFRDIFQACSDQIGRMNDYKLVHDLLQELETAFAVVALDVKYLPERSDTWERLGYNEPAVSSKIEEIITVMRQGAFESEEESWVKMLGTAAARMRLGIEDLELPPLKSGTKLINQIINRQPSLFNEKLVITARELRLDALEQAMSTICDNLIAKKISLDKLVQEIQAGVDALDGLDERMQTLVGAHDDWQKFDDELRRAENELRIDMEVFIFTWEDIKPMAEERIEAEAGEWAEKLTRALQKINDACAAETNEKIGPFFNRFRSETGRRFREVDMELLTLCQELQRVGEQLDLLLRSFNK